jgi:hypothetical protein
MFMKIRGRAAGACLVGFAGTFFTNMVLTNTPDIGETNARAADFYTVAANRAQAVAAFYAVIVAVACLIGVLATLLPPARARGHDGVVSAAWMSGGAFIGLYLAGGAAFLVPTATVALNFTQAPIDPVFARTMSTWGAALFLIAAPVALAACVAFTCRAAQVGGAMPGWLVYFGYAVAVCLLAGWTWFPLPLTVIWALIAGLRLLIRPQRVAERAEDAGIDEDTGIDQPVISPA